MFVQVDEMRAQKRLRVIHPEITIPAVGHRDGERASGAFHFTEGEVLSDLFISRVKRYFEPVPSSCRLCKIVSTQHSTTDLKGTAV
jgi:hypothetical protein